MLEPIKFFCNFALPAVYDDSLSYYDVLTKLTAKLNEVISNLNSANAQIELLTPKVTKLVNEVGTRPDSTTDTLWVYAVDTHDRELVDSSRITGLEHSVGVQPDSVTQPLWDYSTSQNNEINKLKTKKSFIDLSGNIVFILPKQSTESWWNEPFIKQRICNILNKDENSVLIEWINPTTSTPSSDMSNALLNIQANEIEHSGFNANTSALIIGLGSPDSSTSLDDYAIEVQKIVDCVSEFPNLKNTIILPSYGYNIYSMESINERMLQINDQIPSRNAIIDDSLGNCLVLGEIGIDSANARNNAMVNFCDVLCDFILYGLHRCNYIISDSSFGFLKNINGEISYFPAGTQIVSGTVNFNYYTNAINTTGINTSVGFGSGKTDGKECIFALAITNNAVGSTSYTAITPYKNTITLGRKFS